VFDVHLPATNTRYGYMLHLHCVRPITILHECLWANQEQARVRVIRNTTLRVKVEERDGVRGGWIMRSGWVGEHVDVISLADWCFRAEMLLLLFIFDLFYFIYTMAYYQNVTHITW